MVRQKKVEEVKKLKELFSSYPVIGIVDLTNMPSKPLQLMRRTLRGKAIIRVSKKTLIARAIKELGDEKLLKLLDYLQGQPALIFSKIDPFKLYKILEKEKSPAPAKEGDVAIKDVVVRAGPTPIPTGPAIALFQRLKIPTMVKEGKIHVREDTVVIKKGETFSAELASLLQKLGIEPMEIMLNMVAAYEDGVIYTKDVLAVDEEEYKKMLLDAYTKAFNLSVNIVWPTKQNIKVLITKAFIEAKNLGINANIYEKGVIEDLIRKAAGHANALKNKINV